MFFLKVIRIVVRKKKKQTSNLLNWKTITKGGKK